MRLWAKSLTAVLLVTSLGPVSSGAAAQSPARCDSHTVAWGDSLSAISDRYNIHLGELKTANPGLRAPFVLQPGDILCIPSRARRNIATLDPDVPESTAYSGQLIIELELPQRFFAKPRVGGDHILRFNGEDGFLELPDGYIAKGRGTVAHWVQVDDQPAPGVLIYTTNQGSIFGGSGRSVEITVLIDDAKHVNFIYRDGRDNSLTLVSRAPLTPEKWQHIAVTYDTAGLAALYIDGALDGALAFDGPSRASQDQPHGVVFGKSIEGADHFAGRIDDLQIWTRALPAADICVMTQTSRVSGRGHAGFWGFNEGKGRSARNRLSSSESLRLEGGVSWQEKLEATRVEGTPCDAQVAAASARLEALRRPPQVQTAAAPPQQASASAARTMSAASADSPTGGAEDELRARLRAEIEADLRREFETREQGFRARTEAEIEDRVNTELARRMPATAPVPLTDALRTALKAALDTARNSGVFDARYFPNLTWVTTEADRQAARAAIESGKLDDGSFFNRYAAGQRLRLYRTTANTLRYEFVTAAPEGQPSLFLVESYRLSSFLGAYGTGRILNTFTLLPQEEAVVSIETYQTSLSGRANSSSILDSFSEASAKEFENAVETEQSRQVRSRKSLEVNVSAQAEARWGFGKASLSSEVTGKTNVARETFARNISNAVQKHAAKASASRNIQVNRSSSTSTESGEKQATQRVIRNPNGNRTLNFLFYQMNQEYFTILHLVDVQVGFYDGAGTTTILPLSEFDALLALAIPDEDNRAEVQRIVLGEIRSIADYQGRRHPDFVTSARYLRADGAAAEEGYRRIDTTYQSCFRDDDTCDTARRVPGDGSILVTGLVVSADKIVLRTDGIYAEALLGKSDAWDEHNLLLNRELLRKERILNDLLERNQRYPPDVSSRQPLGPKAAAADGVPNP